MFCAQCGASNADSATVCVQCGGSLQPAPVLTVQPPPIPQHPGVLVPNYLVFAILATVLCCLPAGVAAIVYAAQVNGKLQAGDIAGAQAASKNAKMWCWISFGLGLAFTLVMVVGTIRQIGSR
jgi:hypothetical protein